MILKLRPHHFLCTLCYEGKGYNLNFIQNYDKIIHFIQSSAEENISIEVVAETDHICYACPHQRGNLCVSQSKIDTLDQGHQKALDLKPGMTLSWKEAKDRIKNKLTLEIFHHICAACSWKDLGICEEKLSQFIQSLHEEN